MFGKTCENLKKNLYYLIRANMSETNIYVLKLVGGKYYVGKSHDLITRYQQHINGEGSAWTRKYKPVKMVRKIINVSPFEEDKITKEYMSKYGIENVRGGSYVNTELTDFQVEGLQVEIWSANGLCTQCGHAGHFVKDCYAKTDVNGDKIIYEGDSDDSEIVWCCDKCDKEFSTEKLCEKHENICRGSQHPTCQNGKCYRCGREGHYSPECYASRHVKGYYLDD